jgi:hypothetical protein
VTALVRYVAADALRAERWAAPVLVFLAATASFNAGGGSALSCYSFTAAVLLPVALWLTVAVSNSEDPVQEAVTTVTVGSGVRVRLAKLLTAALVCVLLAAVSLVWSPVAGNPSSARSVLAGAVAHAVTIAAGVAFGAVLSRPVVSRRSVVVLGATGLLLLELALPVPPLRPLLSLFGDDHPRHLALPLLGIAAETAALSVTLVAVALRVARARS